MKKKKINFKEPIFAVLLFPVVLLFMLYLLIITPFDYFKYKKTHYYKDTKEKYSWLCMSSYYIRFYDLIKNENLPIDYYRFDDALITGYGFFIYKDMLILNDYDVLCYDEEKNIWLVEIDDEYVDMKEDVENVIDRCNKFLKNNICKRAVVLIDKDLFEEHPNVKYENIDFLPGSDSLDTEALKTLIN